MADNKKIYSIQINGIDQSINAVDALNKQLLALENRIKELEKSDIKINTSGGSTKTTTDDSIAKQKELNQLKKEELQTQKEIAAQQRLTAGEYDNTMKGMKQNLADIKTVINSTDLGDTTKIKQMTQDAGELNKKLLEIEKSYGQFGRNVGNYANGVAEGLQKVKINVGGTVREFDNARQASKTLNNELKAMAVNGQQGTQEFKNLRQAVLEMESTMNDAKKPMDNLMDTMESVVAIASAYKGIGAFFGFDGDEIQKSIQKLLALQTALKGIQTIQKQIQTQEGIGGWIAKASKAMDTFAASVTKSEKATKGLSLALKGLTGVAVVAAIIAITKALSDLKKKQDDVNKSTEDGLNVYAKAETEIKTLQTKLNNFNGTKAQEKRLVEELNSKYGTALGQYKSLQGWKNALINKGKAYCQILQKEAEMQAIVNLYQENYIKLQKARKLQEEGQQDTVDLILKGQASLKQILASIKDDFKAPFSDNLTSYNDQLDEDIHELEKNGEKLLAEINNLQSEIDKIKEESKTFDYSDQIDKNSKKTLDALKQAEERLNQLKLKMMKDGLNKTLQQLEEEKRQTINKIKENGVRVQEQIKQTEKTYYQLKLNAIDEYLKKFDEEIKDYSKKIAAEKFEINTKEIEYQINALNELIRKNTEDASPYVRTLTSRIEYQTKVAELENDYKAKGLGKSELEDNLFIAAMFNAEKGKTVTKKELDAYHEWLDNEFADLIADIKEKNQDLSDEAIYQIVEENIKTNLKKELDLVSSYGFQMEGSLKESFRRRIENQRGYNDKYLENVKQYLTDIKKLQEKEANDEFNRLYEEEDEKYSATTKSLEDRKAKIKDGLAGIEKVTVEAGKKMTDEELKKYNKLKEQLKETDKQLEDELVLHGDRQGQIMTDYKEKQVKIENDYNQRIISNTQKYYDSQLSNYRDFLSKMNTESSKQPIYDKAGFGIINLKKTKENYNEILDAATYTIEQIKSDKEKLNDDFQNGLIDPANYNSTLTQLNDLETETKNTAETVGNNLKEVGTEWWKSIDQWIQNIGSTITSVMSSLSEITSNHYDEQISQQEKFIDEYGKLLDKQKDITQKYADDVNSIEDELKTARGDRRQQLIDQLNAEMAAQRDSLAQEKKIEKEKEKAEQKKKKLEHDQAVAEKKMSIWQAAINAAMAVSMAAVNHWPIPAIPMMSMAAAVGAAQLAAVMSKPIPTYATGGVIEGPSHAAGGVKVLGGRAEVEGREFITNRVTTQENVDLMYYINSKKRKLDIDDFIEFYSGSSVKKNIQSVRTKFADGGQIPTLRNDITINDRLITAMEDYAERPVQVAVVDIIDRTQAVNDVKVMAGLEV